MRIEPVTKENVADLKMINNLCLEIKYSDKFYQRILEDSIASFVGNYLKEKRSLLLEIISL